MPDPRKKKAGKGKSRIPKLDPSAVIRWTILGRIVDDRPPNPVEPYIVLMDDPFTEFQESIKSHLEGYVRVKRATTNLRFGKFGKWRDVGEGVRELKIDCGEGYRIYYGQVGGHILILVGAGEKSDQDADIERAIKRWKEIEDGIEKH